MRPEILVAALAVRPYVVMARHLDTVVVAADPIEVVNDLEVWTALEVPVGKTDPLAMAGGWMGLLPYDFGGTVERLPQPLADPGGPGGAVLARYGTVALIDATGSCTIASIESSARLRELADIAEALGEAPPMVAPRQRPVHSSLPVAAYAAVVERARGLIAAGDCYQVNLAQRLTCEWTGDPLAFAARLWDAAGPTSHRAFFQLPGGTLVSASPELLVRATDALAISEPIKGTMAAGRADDLAQSAKDRAEHVMIVDLVRNDLGRVGRAGGVSVPQLMTPLTVGYVDHLVSRVRAQLRADVTAADLLRAVFPGGSVTGCPKVRAMEVIRDLEPANRGPAYGSLLAMGTNGTLEASILIRTAWLTAGEARYWSGGAVVWDSDPIAEHAEAQMKAAPFRAAVNACE